MMISARDNSNAFLVDQVRNRERMRALTAATHVIDDEDIEIAAYCVVARVVWTACLVLLWV